MILSSMASQDRRYSNVLTPVRYIEVIDGAGRNISPRLKPAGNEYSRSPQTPSSLPFLSLRIQRPLLSFSSSWHYVTRGSPSPSNASVQMITRLLRGAVDSSVVVASEL